VKQKVGDPKKPKKKYERPRKPWDRRVLEESTRLAGLYGLRNKRELWRAAYIAGKYRRIARKLLELPKEQRAKSEKIIIGKLQRMGVLGEGAMLDDVLDLSTESILERRLQTLVWRKGFAKTPYMARQLIVHGKVMVAGRRIRQPGYLVPVEEEGLIECLFELEPQAEKPSEPQPESSESPVANEAA